MSAGILVGTDFSDGSALALAEARRLARGLDVPLHVVHVAETVSGKELPEEASAWLQSAEMATDSVAVRPGVPAVELARLARDLEVRLIVLGTHGASGFQPMALGATASRLALLAPCPVVLVGPRGRVRGPAQATRRNLSSNRAGGGRTSEPTGPAASGERS
jgi:nucleotide-binding universal stress UspA family protein